MGFHYWNDNIQYTIRSKTMDAMTWTVLQLMTDTEVLEQQRRDAFDLEAYQRARAEEQAIQ